MSKKKNRQQLRNNEQKSNVFELRRIAPLTPNQQLAFDAYSSGNNMVLHGYAGTGKTYISLYLALQDVLSSKSLYDKIVIVRSVVPSRDIGFLPGNIKEKTRVYEEPYKEICDDLFGKSEYEMLKMRGIIHFTTTSFLRGTTFNDAIVICDEIQNFSFGENDTVMTRMGNNSRIILCGDYRQSDLLEKDRIGLGTFLKIVQRMNNFSYIDFGREDIVRSGLVKDYIINKTEMGY